MGLVGPSVPSRGTSAATVKHRFAANFRSWQTLFFTALEKQFLL
jgi:hypothetical protein